MNATTPRPASGHVDEAVLKALASGSRPTRPGGISAVLTFAWRGMLKIKHVPEQLMDVTIMPVLMVLLFTYLFGGAVAGSTQEYLQFLLPGLLSFVLFSSIYLGVALNTDAKQGVIDRFRSLPVPHSSPLVGGMLGDAVRYTLSGAVLIGVGAALGFRADGGLPGVLAAVTLAAVLTSGLSWVFATAGLLLRSPNAVASAGNMVFFPLVFLSNVFVPQETMPRWLQVWVDISPVAHLATATRALMNGSVDTVSLVVVLGTAATLTLVFLPLTTWLYRRA